MDAYMVVLCLSIVMLWVLNYFDALTTYILVCRHGTRSERNPIARWFIRKFGAKKGLIYIKCIIVLLTPLMIYAYILSPSDLVTVLQAINILYAVVVYHNVRLVAGGW